MQFTNQNDHEDRRTDEQWIRANIDILELHAAEQFRQHGRGALVLDDSTPGNRDLHYRPAARISEQGEVKGMVTQYSPGSQIVIVFVKSDDLDSYVLTIAEWRSTAVH